jgi:hypothetical protein
MTLRQELAVDALLRRIRTAIRSTASSLVPSVWPEIEDRTRHARQQGMCDGTELAAVFHESRASYG